MTDDPVIAIADRMERDAWSFVADAPPNVMALKDLCALAAQLRFSQIFTERDGCSTEQAQAFVVEADNLSLGIERLGARIAGSCLERAARDAQAFSVALLDMMVAGNACPTSR
jgi:hypothetical protein